VGGFLAGVEFRDAGRKQLKGIKDRQRVFEIVWRRPRKGDGGGS
jgi:hypothetical protein